VSGGSKKMLYSYCYINYISIQQRKKIHSRKNDKRDRRPRFYTVVFNVLNLCATIICTIRIIFLLLLFQLNANGRVLEKY